MIACRSRPGSSRRQLPVDAADRFFSWLAAAIVLGKAHAVSDVIVSDELAATFATDGVVKIPGAIDQSFIDDVLTVADKQLRDPGEWITDTNPGATTGRLFTTRYLWPTDPAIHRFAFESGVAELAGRLMGATSTRLYFDHLLVKEPDTTNATPWHQDIPYWPFLGKQICSIWVACSDATVAESSLEFVRGSHRWDAYYAPEAFGESAQAWVGDFEGERCPDVEGARDDYDIVGFDVEAGDAIAFSSWIVHGARGNDGGRRRVALSTRWLGDDSTWYPHAGCDPTVTDADTTSVMGSYPADDARFPVGWRLS